MTQEQKEQWHKKYQEFCKETGGQIVFYPGYIKDTDGSYKITINADVSEYLEEKAHDSNK